MCAKLRKEDNTHQSQEWKRNEQRNVRTWSGRCVHPENSYYRVHLECLIAFFLPANGRGPHSLSAHKPEAICRLRAPLLPLYMVLCAVAMFSLVYKPVNEKLLLTINGHRVRWV